MSCRGDGEFTVQERGSLALTRLVLQSAIRVLAGGSLTMHDSTFSDTITVFGMASLTGCTLAASARLTASGGGSMSLALMAVPAATLRAAEDSLTGAGSTLRLDAVTWQEAPDVGELTGITTVDVDGAKSVNPPNFFGGTFAVSSGPCTVSEGGRCVGRPEGYGPNEDCAITVVVGGVLGPCPVFDLQHGVTHPDYVNGHAESNCPEGEAHAPGDAITWHSNVAGQGSAGNEPGYHNGCAAKGTCGLPWSERGLGGGWELCFA